MKVNFPLFVLFLFTECSKAFVPTNFLLPKIPKQNLKVSPVMDVFEINAKKLIQDSDKIEAESMGSLLAKIENEEIQEIIFSQDLRISDCHYYINVKEVC
jgi:hypothetical protein